MGQWGEDASPLQVYEILAESIRPFKKETIYKKRSFLLSCSSALRNKNPKYNKDSYFWLGLPLSLRPTHCIVLAVIRPKLLLTWIYLNIENRGGNDNCYSEFLALASNTILRRIYSHMFNDFDPCAHSTLAFFIDSPFFAYSGFGRRFFFMSPTEKKR